MSIDAAIEDLRAGRLERAASVLQELIDKHADPDALHLMGIVRHAQGDYERAEVLVRRAIGGRSNAAIFHATLGMILADRGDPKAAIAATARAVELAPNRADILHNHGVVLARAGKLEEAIAVYQRGLQADPNVARLHASLGHAFFKTKKLGEALAEFALALALDRRCVDAHWGTACVLSTKQESAGAIEHLELALAIDPNHVPSLVLLSMMQSGGGNGAEAEALAMRALGIAPDDANAHSALGNARAALGKLEAARESYGRAAALSPDNLDYILSSATLLLRRGDIDAARKSLEACLEKHPKDARVLESLATTYYLGGHRKRAIELARESIALDGSRLAVRSFLLGVLCADDSIARGELLALAAEWNRLASARSQRLPTPADLDRSPTRTLRVGYVSGDLRGHPIGYAMATLLPRHDPRAVKIFLYANQSVHDETTQLVRRCEHTWRDVLALSDDALAKTIRADKIDILVDLSGHTDGHRLEMFTRKPAPIQATWLGYYGTTGVTAIDWIIGDEHVLPKDEEGFFVERPWRLPGCYIPITKTRLRIIVGSLPAFRTGQVTFGCFNNLIKITDPTIALWARILSRVEGSRLVLKTRSLNSESVRNDVRARFAAFGIEGEQKLILLPSSPRVDFLRHYNDIDIALDPFPYNGGTTTLEALFMGVPVVCKRGSSFVGHIAETIAQAAGIPELIGKDEDEYVEIAVRLAKDLDALSTMRATLRPRVDAVSDPKGFARKLEAAYRGMWERYLVEHPD